MISAGVDGYVSLEVSPSLARDSEGTALEGKRLYELLDRPNVMIKVPATPEGIPAVRRLVGQGINVNVTLIFSVRHYEAVVQAYLSGLEDLLKRGGKHGYSRCYGPVPVPIIPSIPILCISISSSVRIRSTQCPRLH
ncbi:Transaldolase [subsurface metagenome]